MGASTKVKVRHNGAGEVVRIPWRVFQAAESKEELEDWLLAHNPAFVARMRQARREDKEGKWRPLKEVARRLHIKLS